jgi:hypothetical protein
LGVLVVVGVSLFLFMVFFPLVRVLLFIKKPDSR